MLRQACSLALAGIVLLAMFVLYMVLTVRQSFRDTVRAGGADEAIDGTPSMGKDILLLVVGAAFIAVGANLLVNNGTLIAQGTPDHVRNHPAVIEAYLGSDDSETW